MPRICLALALIAVAAPVLAQSEASPDYVSLFAARTAEVPERERAYPLYAEAHQMLMSPGEQLLELQHAKPGDPEWTDACELLDECTELIKLTRRIAAKPDLGYRLTHPGDELWNSPLSPDDPLNIPRFKGALMGMMLPHLGTIRAICRLERLQARRYMHTGDAAGAVECIARIRTLSDHAAEQTVAISRLVAISLEAQALTAAEELLANRDALDDQTLARLKAIVASVRFTRFEISWLADEELMARDFFERIYARDPDGLITQQGMSILDAMSEVAADVADDAREHANSEPPDERQPAEDLVWLMFRAKFSTRHETLSDWDSFIGATTADAKLAPWTWDHYPGDAEQQRIDAAFKAQDRYSVALLIFPDISRLARSADQLRLYRDATLTTIALEQYRRAYADWPETLDQLVPDFLDAIPPDRADGKPLRYRRTDGGGATLYSLGPDRDDDGGVPTAEGQEWRYFWPAELDAARNGEPEAPDIPDGDFVHWQSEPR
jgi:hypothetical protein